MPGEMTSRAVSGPASPMTTSAAAMARDRRSRRTAKASVPSGAAADLGRLPGSRRIVENLHPLRGCVAVHEAVGPPVEVGVLVGARGLPAPLDQDAAGAEPPHLPDHLPARRHAVADRNRHEAEQPARQCQVPLVRAEKGGQEHRRGCQEAEPHRETHGRTSPAGFHRACIRVHGRQGIRGHAGRLRGCGGSRWPPRADAWFRGPSLRAWARGPAAAPGMVRGLLRGACAPGMREGGHSWSGVAALLLRR